MTALLLLALLPLALASSPDQRIINGMTVSIAQYPWQGAYRDGNANHVCGCVYVGGVWALTAGHCGGSTAYSVGLGSTDRTQMNMFTLAYVIRHPNYDQGTGFTPNDYAVVRINSVPSGSNISPGTIAANATNPGGTAHITGWGRTCEGCALPINLQGVPNIPVISDSECASRVSSGSFNAASMICVYNANQGACYGDGGGPMSTNTTILGLCSWGRSTCTTGYPSVYAKVGAVRSWICSTSENQISGC